MVANQIINGSFDGTINGWTFEGPSVATVTDLGAYEGLFCALIIYDRNCAIVRGTRINQTITIPAFVGDVFLEFWERTFFSYWAGSCGIKFDDTWIWSMNYRETSRRGTTTQWAKQSINVNEYKGQTVQLAITWHDPSATYCNYGDHIGWLRVDDIKLIFPSVPTHEIKIMSNPTYAIIKVDGQII